MTTYFKKNMRSRKRGSRKLEEKTYDQLIVTLDSVFSKYVRLRDSQGRGYFKCITCPIYIPWKEGTAGHFIKRNRLAVRYNEKNVNGQCFGCNSYHDGKEYEHAIAIDKKYGKGTAEYLRVLGAGRGAKLGSLWLIQEIKKYRKKVKYLLQDK